MWIGKDILVEVNKDGTLSDSRLNSEVSTPRGALVMSETYPSWNECAIYDCSLWWDNAGQ